MYQIRNGYDRRKHPTFFKVRLMGKEEMRKLKRGDGVWFHSNDGGARMLRVTGQTQTWKTRPDDFRFPVKYGMYESATCEWTGGRYSGPNLLVIVETISPMGSLRIKHKEVL